MSDCEHGTQPDCCVLCLRAENARLRQETRRQKAELERWRIAVGNTLENVEELARSEVGP